MSARVSMEAHQLFEDAIDLADLPRVSDGLNEICARIASALGFDDFQAQVRIDGVMHTSTGWHDCNHDAARKLVLFDNDEHYGLALYQPASGADETCLALAERTAFWALRMFHSRRHAYNLEFRNASLREVSTVAMRVAEMGSYASAGVFGLNLLARHFRAIGSAAWIYDSEHRSLTLRYTSDGFLRDYLGWTLPLNRVGPHSEALLENRSFVTPRYIEWFDQEPEVSGTVDPVHNMVRDIRNLVGGEGDVTLLGIPLMGEDGLLGMLALVFDELPEVLIDPRSEYLSIVGRIIAGALRSVDLSERHAVSETWLSAKLEDRNRELEATTRRLRQAAAANARMQETERRDIARELHDTTSQVFTGLAFRLKLLSESPLLKGTEELCQLEEIGRLIQTIHDQQRGIVEMLDPSLLRQRGLVVAISNLLIPYMVDESITWDFVVKGDARRLNPETEKAVYRIVGEAVSNAARYAEAGNISVSLDWQPLRLTVDVSDDGIGFDKDRVLDDGNAHHGLLNMQDRAMLAGATIVVDAAPGKGTHIRVVVPIDEL